jgi:inosine-uridine nucleoside N-ribohydrolase
MVKIPIILDTDIGSDIDDTWALGMALNCPELDIKLITTATGNTEYRAKIVAKFLEEVGRDDIPIGIGPLHKQALKPQKKYVKKNNLNQYRGIIYQDAAKAIVDTIMGSNEIVKIVAIGPLENISNALKLEPKITENSEFIGMHGSVNIGYGNSSSPSAEYNVIKDIQSFRDVINANWNVSVTPLDTCGDIILDGELFQELKNSNKPIIDNILINYKFWAKKVHRLKDYKNGKSSVLFDTVVIYMAFSTDLLNMEEMKIIVDNKGFTKTSDDAANPMNIALSWRDKELFLRLLVDILKR